MNTASLVVVTWNDSGSSATLIYEEARDHKPIVMHTVGWLMKQDKTGVTVACEMFIEDGNTRYRGWTFVPDGMVISVRRVTSRKSA